MLRSIYRFLRRKLIAIAPSTMVGRLAMYVFLLRVGVFVLQQILLFANNLPAARSLDGWAAAFTFFLGSLLIILILRWMRNQLLWRLRNRLIVTYVFIGVIPVLLILTMVGIGGWMFANQYVTAQSSIQIDSELHSLELVTQGIADQLGRETSRTAKVIPPASLNYLEQRFPGLQVTAWQKGKEIAQFHAKPAEITLPEWVKGSFRGIVEDSNTLFLRTAAGGGNDVIVVISVPLSKALVDRAAEGLGLVRYFPMTEISPQRAQENRGVKFTKTDGKTKTNLEVGSTATISGGKVPEHGSFAWDPEIAFPNPSPFKNWTTGEDGSNVVIVSTRPSVVVQRLFAYAGAASGIWLGVLAGIGIFFALIEVVALFFGIGLTRTVTKGVSNLYQATEQINSGNLKHRIPVKSKDQLAALQISFNSMSENLEKLLKEQKEKERLQSELAIAQEVQATLFPREVAEMETLEVHGVCRPARSVSGDYYDFLPCGNEQLGIALGDISGKGISAALLMATVHSAVRAYEFGRMPMRHEFVRAGAAALAGASLAPGEQEYYMDNGMQSPALALELLNRHLYQSTQPEKYATLFLGVYDGVSRTLTYSNAGHLAPIIISEDGSVRRLEIGGMVIGLFDDEKYKDAVYKVKPHDIFVAFSDGITEPENEFGEFGEERLIEIVRANRKLPLARVSEAVTTAVQDWIGAAEQPDDVTLVLARAR